MPACRTLPGQAAPDGPFTAMPPLRRAPQAGVGGRRRGARHSHLLRVPRLVQRGNGRAMRRPRKI